MSKIMIVEDDIDTAKLLAQVLSRAGYEVLIAGDAYQAVSISHKTKPDLILLDLMLPAGGGLAVLERVRSSIQTLTTPVIVLTAMEGHDDYIENVRKLGINDFMHKPFQPQLLLGRIKEILENGK